MDRLDLRILQTMGFVLWGREPIGFDALSTGYIADEVGTTSETVRKRVRAMEDKEIIEGYQVYPSLTQLDLTATAVVFTVPDPDEKARAFERVGLIDGVLDVTDFHGPRLLVGLAHRTASERDRRVRLLARETGDDDPRIFENPERAEPERRLTHLDWRIVRALRGQADRSFSEIAEDVGVSRRTVKRHVDRMTADESLFVAPLVDPGEIPSLIPFDLFAELEERASDATRNELANRFPERLVSVRAPGFLPEDAIDLVLFAETMSEVEQMRQEASKVDGVERAQSLITRRSLDTEWLDERIEERVAATADDERA